MAKGYWITCYRSVRDAAALASYAKAAGPAIEGHGGHFLARGIPVKGYESGLNQRLVIIEFESTMKAIEAYESPEYQALSQTKGCRRARHVDHMKQRQNTQ